MKINKKCTGILLANLVIFTAIFIWVINSSKSLPKVNYAIEDWKMDHVVYRDQAFSVSDEIKNAGEAVTIFWGPYQPLPEGSYTAIIQYSADEDQHCLAEGYRQEADRVESSPGLLSRFLTTLVYPFEAVRDVENFELSFTYSGHGDFSIRSVSVVPNNNRVKRLGAEAAAAVLFADILIMFAGLPERKKKTVIAIAGIALLASLPLAIEGIYSGHDLEVHLLRIEGIVQSLRSGRIPSRISSVFLYGRGYPFSVFYNDIFLYFPAVLRLLGFSLTSAYKLFIIFLNLLKVLIAYASFRRIAKNDNAGVVMTLLFSLASYRFTNLYVRAAAGEYTAQVFLPLFALAAERIFFEERRSFREIMTDSLLLAGAMSGMIGSHIPTTFMAVFILLLICLYRLKAILRKQTLLTLVLAVLMTVILNLYFLFPFADYYLNVPTVIRQDTEQALLRIQTRGAYPAQLFSVFQTVSGMADVNIAERMQVSPGLPLIVVFMAAVWFWPEQRKNARYRFALFFASLTLLLSSSVFPWDMLSDHIPPLRFLSQMVQFPWRFLEFSVLFLTLAAAELPIFRTSFPFRFSLIVLSIMMVCWFTGNLIENCEIIHPYDLSSLDRNWIGSQGQYLLEGTDIYVNNTELQSENMSSAVILSRESDRVILYCESGNGAGEHSVTVPVYNYRGYRVKDETGKDFDIRNNEQNLIRFTLPDGFTGNVTVVFQPPAAWTAALLVSAAAAAAACFWFCADRRKKAATASECESA